MLTHLLQRLERARVLVIGDLMLDHYIWGDVHRISPEAPVPVVNVTRDTYVAGGAANVSLNLSNLGVSTTALGYCADDEAGRELYTQLSANGVNVLNPAAVRSAPTIIKTRVVIRGQQFCRIDREAARTAYSIDHNPDFERLINDALKNTDAVVLSDYAKGVITQPLLDYVLRYARNHPKLFVAVDPKPSSHLSYANVNLLTPNRSEALELAGMKPFHPNEDYPLEEVCRRINHRFKPQILIVTLGAEGMAISTKGKVTARFATEAHEVFDVSGAGDAVIAVLTASLAVGASVADAARLANAAAGCVVAHMGTAPVVKTELHQRLQQISLREIGEHVPAN